MHEALLPGVVVSGGGPLPAHNPRTMPVSPTELGPERADEFERGLRSLWARAQAGDEAAYREALQRMATRLRPYIRRRLTAWPDEAEDLLQETLLAMHLQRGSWDGSVPVSAWMFAIARHKLVDLWRRHGRRAADLVSLDDLEPHESPADPSTEAPAARRDLGVLLQAIPQAQRKAIVWTKIEGRSVAEVSADTGASVAAVKVQVHRGLRKLAELVRSTT